ncbi:alpha mannosidase-like protein [Lentinula aff. detonsa]|uniref:alpha-1,2-Mannosidase n=1 Tax=Lentinula aff. detonsa TaxID=2804958 RepID=A0AA38KRY7_9AGAR|nr:alpha mannosidase-like protein [Lentinula aff. detonsa]KAJ3800419.1 alpha mannosidase-like protein [Lentinula aff. detonsa]
MKLGWLLPECLAALALISLERLQCATALSSNHSSWTSERKLAARERTRSLWYHGFNNYMDHAFPLDELTPLSCSGQGPDWADPANIAANDVAGNFSLTLIDVLDTFVVLDDRKGFETAVRDVIQWVSFDVNTKPQVFETTIRVLGGLLSGHIFASESGPFHLPWYRGELLNMAHDLGKRLLPAFSTPTGLPLARINLRHGLTRGETVETCTAGAGSLILEFATLSRLTGDERFEKAAYKAFFAIWNRKSDIGLVGNTINTWTGDWTSPEITGIGAGIDSFYEYALKWYILSGEVEFLDVWDDAYASIMRYSRAVDGFWYRLVNMRSGDVAYNTIDSLSAFWPGLQVLAGDVQNAIKLHMAYYNLWRKHSGLPEVYDTSYKQATSHGYPLRPEFIESTWYLYRATRDPYYLEVGERVLFDILTRANVSCGLTGIQDLRSNKQDDRMESFALSETLKYLFLLFDEENPLHEDDSNYVFTTEGHLLKLGPEHLKEISPSRRKLRKVEDHQCPAYQPFRSARDRRKNDSGLVVGIQGRSDADYSRELVALDANEADSIHWSRSGWCEKPKIELFSYDFILSPNGKVAPEDLSPSKVKLEPVPDGYVIQNVSGIRTHIVQRFDGTGYDVRKLGHYTVRAGQLVYINDSSLLLSSASPSSPSKALEHFGAIQLRFYVEAVDTMFSMLNMLETVNDMDLTVTGHVGFFGGDLLDSEQLPSRFVGLVPVYRDDDNELGCTPYQKSFQGGILLARRGECTFLKKLVEARDAGAVGVLVISDEDNAINPTASSEDLEAAGDISAVAIVVLPRRAGQLVEQLLDTAQGIGQIMLSLEHEHQPGVDAEVNEGPQEGEKQEETENDPTRILYLNGHPLLNTRLLV